MTINKIYILIFNFQDQNVINTQKFDELQNKVENLIKYKQQAESNFVQLISEQADMHQE
jgi:hypothetical protein